MKYLNVHSKKLPIPSFFQVYNFGGGNGDKDREIVYSALTEDTPALVNYFYINNEYKHLFSNKLFNNATTNFNNVGDLYNYIRDSSIQKGEIYSKWNVKKYDFNNKVFILDSGAFNIIKYIAKSVNYDLKTFIKELPIHIKRYYDFANALRFDIVIGFDFGGKYTEKDNEKSNESLNKFLSKIDKDSLNREILIQTIQYMCDNPNYYPLILATVHGNTPNEVEDNTKFILNLERKYNKQFWGFALGGIASSKQLDDSWFSNIDLSKIGNKPFKDVIAPAIASKIVRKLVENRPIHALGCGGYPNILLNYFNGATSFDAASPVRRVGDGNLESTKIVFNPNPSKVSFSKYFVGGINMDNSLREEECSYVKLNEVPDSMKLCGCNVCISAQNMHNIKYLYSLKETDSEANYYSRQLIGLHAVLQHRKLCETISSYASVKDFCKDYRNDLFLGLDYINDEINKIF